MSNQALQSLMAAAGLDQGATAVMQTAVDNLGPAIQAGLGTIDVDQITTSEVVLVTLVVDDSSSIEYGDPTKQGGNSEAIRQGHNLVLDSLKGAKQSASVLMSCQYLNGTILYPYVTLDNAVRMDKRNYDPRGGTPLYDMTVQVLATVTAKMAEFEQGGVSARSITVIITDGDDLHSRRENEQSVKKVIDAMLRQENAIIAGIGVSDGRTDFNDVFSQMGIRPNWILTPDNSAHDIRAAFQTVSQSAVRASQTAGSFSQTALGGFGA